MASKVKLAEALLRRKELQERVSVLKDIQSKDLFEVKVRRQAVTDAVDDIVAQVPKLEANQVMAEYNYYARQLRLVDACIQQTNWTAEVELADTVMSDYKKE